MTATGLCSVSVDVSSTGRCFRTINRKDDRDGGYGATSSGERGLSSRSRNSATTGCDRSPWTGGVKNDLSVLSLIFADLAVLPSVIVLRVSGVSEGGPRKRASTSLAGLRARPAFQLSSSTRVDGPAGARHPDGVPRKGHLLLCRRTAGALEQGSRSRVAPAVSGPSVITRRGKVAGASSLPLTALTCPAASNAGQSGPLKSSSELLRTLCGGVVTPSSLLA